MPGASRLSACALTKKGDATETTCLSRAEVVLVFKKSNTKGGCFQQQKVNYVSSATISYEGPHCYHQRTPAEELPRGGTERAHELHTEHAQCNRRAMTSDLRQNQRQEQAGKSI